MRTQPVEQESSVNSSLPNPGIALRTSLAAEPPAVLTSMIGVCSIVLRLRPVGQVGSDRRRGYVDEDQVERPFSSKANASVHFWPAPRRHEMLAQNPKWVMVGPTLADAQNSLPAIINVLKRKTAALPRQSTGDRVPDNRWTGVFQRCESCCCR